MAASEIKDLSKLCIHTITTKPWTLEQAAKKYSDAGIKGITVWRDTIEPGKHKEAQAMLKDHGLEIVSYVRGGFFPEKYEEGRRIAVEENKKVVDEAAALGAPLVVLVCGASPGQSLTVSRQQIHDGIAAVLPHAEAAGVKLGIEPLHPMYADSRSAINTLKQATDMSIALNSDYVGVTVDVFHLWWDDQLEAEIKRCGENNKLFSFHICDWKDKPEDMLNDRGLMGEGVIDVKQIRGWVEQAGFSGFNEVEIFSNRYWEMDQDKYLKKIINAYQEYS